MKTSKKHFEKIKYLISIERNPAKIFPVNSFKCIVVYGRKWLKMEGITQKIRNIQSNVLCIDSTSIKVHLDTFEAKRVKCWPFKSGLTTKIYDICSSEKFDLKIQLSVGNCHDTPERKKLIELLETKAGSYLLMDLAYE